MAQVNCPKCADAAMVEMRTSDHVTLDFCDSCNGLWFDANELAEYLGLTRDILDFDTVKHAAKATSLSCPKCNQKLVEMPFAAGADLLIDWCPGCAGTFFDFREAGQAQALAAKMEPPEVRLRVIQERFFKKGFGG